MKTPKLRGSETTGEGHVHFPDKFNDLPDMLRIDLLKDWLHGLEAYAHVLAADMGQEFRMRHAEHHFKEKGK